MTTVPIADDNQANYRYSDSPERHGAGRAESCAVKRDATRTLLLAREPERRAGARAR